MHIQELLENAAAAMAGKAGDAGIPGVAVTAFLGDAGSCDWKLAMKAVDGLKTQTEDGRWFNSACVAFAKLGEMMETRKNSGEAGRPLLGCETGFHGGVVEALGAGYAAAAFSGGSPRQDVELSRYGVDILKQGLIIEKKGAFEQ